jgi:uncharacterized DUF497 family protein
MLPTFSGVGRGLCGPEFPVETRRVPHFLGESRLGRTILVVFTERVASDIIRIIGARRATKRERKAYAEED